MYRTACDDFFIRIIYSMILCLCLFAQTGFKKARARANNGREKKKFLHFFFAFSLFLVVLADALARRSAEQMVTPNHSYDKHVTARCSSRIACSGYNV
jgi:hypothetical protein